MKKTPGGAEIFDRAAETYDTVIPFFRTFGELLVEIADVQREERVLDVAAGRGASALPAARRGDHVVAVDLAPTMMELLKAGARASGITNLSTEVRDAQELPYDSEFDVVLCGFFLHILPTPQPVADHLWRALRDGGRCVISFPTGGGPTWNFFGEVLTKHSSRAQIPLQDPSPSPDLGAVMEASGFRDINMRDLTRRFVFPDPEAWWKWVWSHGQRAPLERFAPDVLEEIKQEMLDRVAQLRTPAGIILDQSARFISGRRVVQVR